MPKHKFVPPSEHKIESLSVEELVDRGGRLDYEIKKRQKLLEKIKNRLKKKVSAKKVKGKDYRAILKFYERTCTDMDKLKKLVPSKVLKKAQYKEDVSSVSFEAL